MEYQMERKARKVSTAGDENHTRTPRKIAVPNSAAAAAYETGYQGLSDLESSILSRLPGKMQPQIPTAENEANRLSAGIAAGGPEDVKRELGSRIGADFSKVRFHTDAGAAAYADRVGARAYTTGSDVYFGTGGFEPSVAAHELVHTVQQGAVGSDAATAFAPSGGIQMLRNPFRRRKLSDAPGSILPGALETLKPGAGNAGAKVAQVKSETGSAVLKPHDNPMMEAAVADFYNAAGSMFDGDGRWSFDAPGVRGLKGSEHGQVMGMAGKSLEGPQAGESQADYLGNASVYSFAGGEHRKDEDAAPGHLEDFQRTMGRVALLDLISGNVDRQLKLVNPKNWKEEKSQNRIHLMDNAFEEAGGMASPGPRSEEWNALAKSYLTKTGQPQDMSLQNFFGSIEERIGTDPMAPLVAGLGTGNRQDSDSYRGGMAETAVQLPQLYRRLQRQYGESSGGQMNEHQTELLRRVSAMHGMLNPDALPLDMPARPKGPAPRPGAMPKRKWWQKLLPSRHAV